MSDDGAKGASSGCQPTATQFAKMERDGFVKVEGLLDLDTVRVMRNEIASEVDAYLAGRRVGDKRYVFARTNHLLEISDLFRIIPCLADLGVHRRLAGFAAALLGVARLRLYHDALLMKAPEHGAVPWHQDNYFSVLEGREITAWVPLHPVTEYEGGLVYAPGSGREGLLDRSTMDDRSVDRLLQARGYPRVSFAMDPGDVLFHSALVFHRSEQNRSAQPRLAFSSFLFEDGATIRQSPFDRGSLVDLLYFPGHTVGDVAASPLNPLVWPTPEYD